MESREITIPPYDHTSNDSDIQTMQTTNRVPLNSLPLIRKNINNNKDNVYTLDKSKYSFVNVATSPISNPSSGVLW